MARVMLATFLAACAWGMFPTSVSAQVTYARNWTYNSNKSYYYKKCTFPSGDFQYLIYYKSKPNWVYWYNRHTEKFWCACPTVNHSKWGNDVRNGKDLFLIATVKSKQLGDTKFPDDADGANFKPGKTTDNQNNTVNLECPPIDLP